MGPRSNPNVKTIVQISLDVTQIAEAVELAETAISAGGD